VREVVVWTPPMSFEEGFAAAMEWLGAQDAGALKTN
jgi:hypothetical protein